MSPLTPVRVYGLEVEAGDMPIPAVPDYFSATLRITMAAIDPSATPQLDGVPSGAPPRATLKLVRLTPDDEDDDEDDEDEDDDDEEEDDDDDIDAIEKRLKGVISDEEDDDDEESSEDEDEKNGGPSDPTKSKKARKAAAVKQLIEALKEADDEMEVDALNGVNGTKLDKGKNKASDDDEDSDFNEDDMNEEIQEFVICTLDPEKNYQQPLDITIGENEVVYFRVEGTHNIYLTGNYVVDPAELSGPDDYEDDDEDLDYEIDSLEDEDEESDELDDIDDPRIIEVDSDEEAPKLIKALDKKGKNKRPADDSDEEVNGLDDLINKSLKSEAAATNGETLSKRQAKKLKNNAGQAVAGSEKSSKKEEKTADEPKKSSKAAEKSTSKSDKKVQFAKNLEQGPTGSPNPNTTKEDKKDSKSKPSLGVKTISGGIKVDDRKLGAGPAAKNGDKVSMRYIGKLEKDGKVFDSNKKGKPFSFTLGKGQVIKGWDLGIAGMQVGGERRVTIPASMGYGSKGMPGIPANSTLVFDVKMLSLN